MNRRFYLLIAVIIGVYVTGMVVDILEIDAAQYASISLEMLRNGNYLQLFDRGRDYLDKPPFLFWISSFSFGLFGVSNITYKLPSVLFSLIGIWSTYRLAGLIYNKSAGQYAALILSSCQAWFLMNNDIKTDTILSAFTAMALWQLYEFIQSGKYRALFFASLGIAGAMLTKGPIGLMIPVVATGTHLVFSESWKRIFDWRWLLIPAGVIALLSPMLWGLYQQFDAHPGKVINGVPIQSGIVFYAWTQSFGRITGGNVWKDDTTAFYFLHTFLWAFAPWGFLFIAGLWRKTKRLLIRSHRLNGEEAFTWGGFVIPLMVLSLSHYKLPHYIFPLFPLAAVITGGFLDNLFRTPSASRALGRWKVFQLVIAGLIFLLTFVLSAFAFPAYWMLGGILGAGFGVAAYQAVLGRSPFARIILPSLISVILFNGMLNVNVYPQLFQYSSSHAAVRQVEETAEGTQSLIQYRERRSAIDFYCRRVVPSYDKLSDLVRAEAGRNIWIFTDERGYSDLLESGFAHEEVKRLEHFHISKLTLLFLNPETRATQLSRNYLVNLDLRRPPQE